MNLNTNQVQHDRPPPSAREGAGGPPQVVPLAVIPATAINPQAAAAVAALAASNDAGQVAPGLEQHYQAYNGTPTGWAAPPPRHPQWQEPEPQQQQQQPPPTLLSSSTTSSIQVQAAWRVGDSCLAKYWEDNKFYPVKVTAVSNKTAVVLYTDFGNHEEVLLCDMLPFAGNPAGIVNQQIPITGNNGIPGGPQSQQQAPRRPAAAAAAYIPTTPGLPPAFPQS